MTNPRWNYLIQVAPTRPTFLEDATEAERNIVGAHFEYLEKLLKNGELLLAGRRDDAVLGIVIISAENSERAHEILKQDPAIQAKVMRGEVHPFRLALLQDFVLP